jgi:hypothetical protein
MKVTEGRWGASLPARCLETSVNLAMFAARPSPLAEVCCGGSDSTRFCLSF